MRPRVSLPNELLHSIVDYIAYKPKLPESGEYTNTSSLVRDASPQLLALSVANWPLRQICLPFLFANIRIRRSGYVHVQKLAENLVLFSRYTKTLFIRGFYSESEEWAISQIVSQLAQLLYVELHGCHRRTFLLKTLLAHPTVTSILVDSLPAQSVCNANLSKVIFNRAWMTIHPDIENYLNQGMRVNCLQIEYEHEMGSKIFPGLKVIRMFVGTAPISSSFLSVLPSTHPTLTDIWLIGRGHLIRHRPLFIFSFIEECERQSLITYLTIERVGIRRDRGQSPSKWFVMGLTLQTTSESTSLIEILALVASSFPKLKTFTLNLESHKATYHVNNLAAVFRQFLSLRTLSLYEVYKRLTFGSNDFPPLVRQVHLTNSVEVKLARAETGLLWFSSQVAKAARTLDAIYIDETVIKWNLGQDEWHVKGWLHVLPSLSQLCSSLPNELLHSIIEYIAYKPKLPNSNTSSLVKRASPELLALSVANWQLRRACLPFLFANLMIRHAEDARKLVDNLPLFSRLTKFLAIGNNIALTEMGDQLLSQLLPRLEKLCRVELQDCYDRTALLRAILAQPTVMSVLVYELPDQSICNDNLSKVIFDREDSDKVFSPAFEQYLNKGMRIGCLDIHDTNFLGSLDKMLASKLREIQIHLSRTNPISFWFLSVLSSTHSTLQELWFVDDYCCNLDTYMPPFLSSFIETSRRQDLKQFFMITGIGLRRALGQSSQEWIVIGLTLQTTYNSSAQACSGSLIKILALVASSFPKLENFTLDCSGHGATYCINNLARALGQFSSLRSLSLDEVYKRLDFGDDNFLPPALRVNPTNEIEIKRARAQAGLYWFSSRVAREGKSLDTIHISDMGDERVVEGDFWSEWYLRGWLYVLNSSRDIEGTLW
ncbi:hypothetical protein C8R42DRAFT_648443 [Lentinula raphanica]|nr:hypothetical protein C8R42DRAFT_648443 [Lentinula raphanica]